MKKKKYNLPKDFNRPSCEVVGSGKNGFFICEAVTTALKTAGYANLVEQYREEVFEDWGRILTLSKRYCNIKK